MGSIPASPALKETEMPFIFVSKDLLYCLTYKYKNVYNIQIC